MTDEKRKKEMSSAVLSDGTHIKYVRYEDDDFWMIVKEVGHGNG